MADMSEQPANPDHSRTPDQPSYTNEPQNSDRPVNTSQPQKKNTNMKWLVIGGSVLAASALAFFYIKARTTDDRRTELTFYGESPPVYPSPIGTGNSSDEWRSAYAKALLVTERYPLNSTDAIDRMLGMVSGQNATWRDCKGETAGGPSWAIPSICYMEGPAGIHGQDFVSAFPAGISLASTFSKDMFLNYGRALGAEYRGKGIHVALAPMLGPMGRVVKGGRFWEGLGPDPYLSGIAASSLVQGIQEENVIAAPKHFLLNEQENRGRAGGKGAALSSNVDDRTLHELYSWPFMDALRAGAGGIMCGYGRANNSYACQNSKLLNGILKTELGFEGFVVSDWEAQDTGSASADAGLDVNMAGWNLTSDGLSKAVHNGTLQRDRARDMLTRLVAAHFFVGQDTDFPLTNVDRYDHRNESVDVRANHTELIREIGAASHILVKNWNKTLPLRQPRLLGIYGYDAEVQASDDKQYGNATNDKETFEGTLITGGGSGSVTPSYVISPFRALSDRDFESLDPAVHANAEANVVLINAYSSEFRDRKSLKDKDSDQLVKNVASKSSNVIVVIHNAGPRVIDEWIDHENVTAVIFAGVPGQESGNALVDVLYGSVNPSGRLPYTLAKQEKDYGDLLNPNPDSSPYPQSDFTEGLYIDYRRFNKDGITPQYPFGYGLSYTTFEYSAMEISEPLADLRPFPPDEVPTVQGGHPWLWEVVYRVAFEIENTGDVAGTEVPQLYLGIPNAPIRQLRGFDRIEPLAPGSLTAVEFALTRRDLSVWNVVRQKWELQGGYNYTVEVGPNSRDWQLIETLYVPWHPEFPDI